MEDESVSLIKGIHHVSLKCCNDKEYEEEIHFYKDILGSDHCPIGLIIKE